jgi:caffeoyl-CoA O-methyltransferase
MEGAHDVSDGTSTGVARPRDPGPVKATGIDPTTQAYLDRFRRPDDDVLIALREETRSAFGSAAGMQISGHQGAVLELLVRAIGARRALEIGTFTGASAICIARALPEDGELICCDLSSQWTAIARRYWERAGVAGRIDLRLGPALETLAKLPLEPSFDFVFIDADKTGYGAYFEAVLPRVRPGGLIVFDNVLWGGRAQSPALPGDAMTLAIQALNEQVAADPRVTSVMLPVGDGITVALVR